MATLVRQKNNRKLLQFIAPDGKKKSIRLGSITMKHASSFKLRIERLVEAAKLNEPIDSEAALWLSKLDSQMYNRVSNAGLIKQRTEMNLGDFLDDYINNRNVKESTWKNYLLTKDNLISYFGASKSMKDIGFSDTEKWRAKLRQIGLSDNTANKRTKTAKQFFESALKAKMITENPFCGLKTSFEPIEEKKHFITKDDTLKIIEQSNDIKTKLIIAFARFAGMRCISEPLALKWEHIDWKNKKINIPKVKTKARVCPLFPELLPYLNAVKKEADPKDEFIITGKEKNSFTHGSVSNRFKSMIKRAGFKDWPKLFVNLRSSRETELVSRFPLHVVCQWLGNSPTVAFKHYLQMKDEYFTLAAEGKPGLDKMA